MMILWWFFISPSTWLHEEVPLQFHIGWLWSHMRGYNHGLAYLAHVFEGFFLEHSISFDILMMYDVSILTSKPYLVSALLIHFQAQHKKIAKCCNYELMTFLSSLSRKIINLTLATSQTIYLTCGWIFLRRLLLIHK